VTLAADGVFPAAVDKSAFIDTLRVSVWGTRRDTPISGVRDLVKEPIGGKRSKYGWIDRGIFVSTGNRYELVYGPLRSRGILPPIVLTLRSDQTPITVEEATEVINALCEGVRRLLASQMELTFDLEGRSVEWFERRIFSSARRFRSLEDEQGRRTFYAGGPTSEWQLRVYEKTGDVVRFEYILRRPFLRKRRVSSLEDLVLLRYLDLGACVSLQRPNMCVMKSVHRNLRTELRRRGFASLFRDLPLREFLPVAEDIFGIPRRDLVLSSPMNEQLRTMRRRLVC
jgi:hypothetical protein